MRIALVLFAACGAPQQVHRGVSIDRFSPRAAHNLVGKGQADAPIDLDRPPFVTQGLAPDGSVVRYYNFDVQSPTPALLHRDNSIDVIPGDPGYSVWIRSVRPGRRFVTCYVTNFHKQPVQPV